MEGLVASGPASTGEAGFEPGVPVPEPILTGLIGTHIQGSKSPDMHMREADAQGIRLAYKLFDLSEAQEESGALTLLLDAVERCGFSGVNITHPFKQQVIEYLDVLSAEARQIGAINTILFRDGRRIGHNTDSSGYAEAFERQLPGASLQSVVQIGAGGAGAATAMAMLQMGCRDLAIHDRDAARARSLVERFGDSHPAQVRTVDDPAEALSSADGIINATPVGMETHPGTPIPTKLLRPSMWVSDVVYFPLETQLLVDARARGCRTADGGGMAVFQAARAFDLFTGRMADRSRMVAEFAGL